MLLGEVLCRGDEWNCGTQASSHDLPMKKLGRSTAHSTSRVLRYACTLPVPFVVSSSRIALNSTNRFTPFDLAMSMKGFMMSMGLVLPGCVTRYTAVIGLFSAWGWEYGLWYVAGSVQSNLTAGRPLTSLPDREATRISCEASCTAAATRRAVLPEDPVMRMVMTIAHWRIFMVILSAKCFYAFETGHPI